MELPSISTQNAAIRGQWLSFDLSIRANVPMVVSEMQVLLENGCQQTFHDRLSLVADDLCTVAVRLRLPDKPSSLPHLEQNSANQRARAINRVLWQTEQAEQHGEVLFRLQDEWHRVPIMVRV